MRLLTLPGVFRPHSDSWILAEVVGREARPGDRVLDPFTGTGILAVAAARNDAEATAIDVSRRAVLCASINARLNGVRLRILRANDTAALGDVRFDLIVANPPYVPSKSAPARGAARAWEGGPHGRRYIDRLCAAAPKRLRPGGRLLMIHSSVCGECKTLECLGRHGLDARVIRRRAGRLGPLMAAGLEERAVVGCSAPETEELLVFEGVN